ncbi:hypothetical protein ACWDAZ_32595 [Streptomyces sp. NPDC001215]
MAVAANMVAALGGSPRQMPAGGSDRPRPSVPA